MNEEVLRMIGKRVRDLRKERGLSQEELGEKAGFHFSYIGGLERAEKNITLLNLQRIADALGISVNQLFLYGRHLKVVKTEKDILLDQINDKLTEMKLTEVKKVHLLIQEIFEK